MDSHPPHHEDNRESVEAPRSLETQMVDALERYAVRVPEEIQAEIDAGETYFEISQHRDRPRAHRFAPTRRGNLTTIVARNVKVNPTVTGRTNGYWNLANLEEGSFVSVAFADDQGVNRVMKSDAKNWVVLHRLTQVSEGTPEGINVAIGFYKGSETATE